MPPQYISVPANAKAFFRMVEENEPQLCPPFGGGDFAGREEVLGKLPEAAARFLLDMDRKLDAILGLLQRDQLLEDFPLHGRVTELSAAGGTFECKQPLAPGDFLELVLLLEELVGRQRRHKRFLSVHGKQPCSLCRMVGGSVQNI